jgi:hypothetical protein
VKKNTRRHSKPLSLYRLAFEEAVSDLLKVKRADVDQTAAQKAEARPKKAKKGSKRKE